MLEPLLKNGRPYWETNFPEELWPVFEDFRNFISIVWDHLGLPEPTKAQYEIAHRLQHGYDSVEAIKLSKKVLKALKSSHREDVIRAFRSLGKSYVAAAYVIWRLARNPRDEKIMVVSASSDKAKQFVSQVKSIIQSLSFLKWLLEGSREGGATRRDEADQFDVVGASISQAYSLCARGVFGQLTGSRATCLIADDIEIERNSLTEDARVRLLKIVTSDFVPITKTEHGRGDIIFLGTPQTEESIYNRLVIEMGFRCFCIPVKYPEADKMINYVLQKKDTGQEIEILAPYLQELFKVGELTHGQPTDTRFSLDELIGIEAKGRSTFALQYMLDTSLSDAERYPLKMQDMIIFSCNALKAPAVIQWGRDSQKLNILKDLPNIGFMGDQYLRPLFVDVDWYPYDGLVLFVDPAGRGADETAWAIVGALHGTFYVLKVDGFNGDPTVAMKMIANDAKKYGVNVIEYEPNYGGGMWGIAFGPILQEVWPGGCTIQESDWAKNQKEARIIDTMEPVLTGHRLVLSEDTLRDDVKRYLREGGNYSLVYQLTHISRDRGALKHDDRLDALSGAINHFKNVMGQDAQQEAQASKEAILDDEYQRFLSWASGDPMSFRNGGVTRSCGRYLGDGDYTEVYIVSC